MHSISDVDTLLASMRPSLSEEVFVFVSLPEAGYGDAQQLEPVAAVREDEGLTLIVPETKARAAGVTYEGIFRRITLQVRSSLAAVGLTAAVAAALAENGIAANVVAGFHHDHIFVPDERADEANALLLQLSASAGSA